MTQAINKDASIKSNTAVKAFFKGFVEHPESVDETYFGHMAFALKFTGELTIIALAALVHAFIPPLFETTASRRIKAICDRMEARHKAAE